MLPIKRIITSVPTGVIPIDCLLQIEPEGIFRARADLDVELEAELFLLDTDTETFDMGDFVRYLFHQDKLEPVPYIQVYQKGNEPKIKKGAQAKVP